MTEQEYQSVVAQLDQTLADTIRIRMNPDLILYESDTASYSIRRIVEEVRNKTPFGMEWARTYSQLQKEKDESNQEGR